MKEKNLDTSILDKAVIFAVKAHSGTERRGKGFPYIVHPMEAVEIVATMTADQELLAAAALHDIVEDTPFTVDDIRAEFGDRIADLVKAETDIDVGENISEAESWHTRKQAAIDRLSHTSKDAKTVALGDKLSNMRAIWRDWLDKGDSIWNIFHVNDPAEHEWHYRGLADALRELDDTIAFKEFEHLINKVFGKK